MNIHLSMGVRKYILFVANFTFIFSLTIGISRNHRLRRHSKRYRRTYKNGLIEFCLASFLNFNDYIIHIFYNPRKRPGYHSSLYSLLGKSVIVVSNVSLFFSFVQWSRKRFPLAEIHRKLGLDNPTSSSRILERKYLHLSKLSYTYLIVA